MFDLALFLGILCEQMSLLTPPAMARPGRSSTQEPEEAPANGLVFHAVENGVQHRGDKKVDIGHESVANGCSVLPVPVYNGEASQRDVEDEDSTEVSDTSVEGSGLLLSGGDAQHGPNDHGVGEGDEQRV